MSFGRELTSSRICDAIDESQKSKGASGYTPLLFAAASNHGLLRGPSFPACDANVICVYALDGEGYDAHRINPPTDPFKDNFGTLGHGIELRWHKSNKGQKAEEPNLKSSSGEPEAEFMSGTSYATPILAATVANYLTWLDCHVAALGPNVHKQARKKEWVIKILRERMMSKQESHSDMIFVAPWNFFHMKKYDLDEKSSLETVKEEDRNTNEGCLNVIKDYHRLVDD